MYVPLRDGVLAAWDLNPLSGACASAGPHDGGVRTRRRAPLRSEQLLAAETEELLEERRVPRVRLELGEDDVADERDEADARGDDIVEEHLAQEPVRQLGLPALA